MLCSCSTTWSPSPEGRPRPALHLPQPPAAGLQGHRHQPPPHGCRAPRRSGWKSSTGPPRSRLLAELANDTIRCSRRPARPSGISLYEETGGKPLLLRWVAGQLGRGQLPHHRRRAGTSSAVARRGMTRWSSSSATCCTSFTAERDQRARRAHLLQPSRSRCSTSPSSAASRRSRRADRARATSPTAPSSSRPGGDGFALVPMVADFLRRKRPEVVAETGNRLEAARLCADRGERLPKARPLPGARCQLAHRGPRLAALPRRAE